MSKPTQVQMFYQEHRSISTVNDDFMWLVKNGLMREDYALCVMFDGFVSLCLFGWQT